MARQTGDIKISGTIGDICFYQMEGEYYARSKSSLSGKRFWKDPAFEGSRGSAERFGMGNRLASQVYQRLPKDQRKKGLFGVLKSAAIALLKQGRAEAQVLWELQHFLTGKQKENRL
jgi:hypothetical protein